MKNETIFLDKITGLKGKVVDVSTNAGPLEIYIKLENGETVTRKVSDLVAQEEEKGGAK